MRAMPVFQPLRDIEVRREPAPAEGDATGN